MNLVNQKFIIGNSHLFFYWTVLLLTILVLLLQKNNTIIQELHATSVLGQIVYTLTLLLNRYQIIEAQSQ